MYIVKVNTTNAATKTVYLTYKLVKNERINGTPTQINLLSLGKLENLSEQDIKLLGARIEDLYEHHNTNQCDLFSIPNPVTIEDFAQFFTYKLI